VTHQVLDEMQQSLAKHGDGKSFHMVDLPMTTFGMRGNSLVKEPEIQKIWHDNDNEVFKRLLKEIMGSVYIILRMD